MPSKSIPTIRKKKAIQKHSSNSTSDSTIAVGQQPSTSNTPDSIPTTGQQKKQQRSYVAGIIHILEFGSLLIILSMVLSTFDTTGRGQNFLLDNRHSPAHIRAVLDLESNSAQERINFHIERISLYGGDKEFDKVCLKRLYIFQSVGTYGSLNSSKDYPFLETVGKPLEFNKLCYGGMPNRPTTIENFQGESISIPLYNNWQARRLYPFDKRNLQFYLLVELATETTTHTLQIPDLNVILPYLEDKIDAHVTQEEAGVRLSATSGDPVEPGVLKVAFVNMTIERASGRKLVTLLFLGLIFLFIITLLLITDTGNAIQVGIANLLGIWSVRDIIVPSSIGESIFINQIVLVLYALLGWVSFRRFLRQPIIDRIKFPKSKSD